MKMTKILTFFALLLFLPANSFAVLKIDIMQGGSEPVRIATPDFIGSDDASANIGRRITGVIDGNLSRSGLFTVINKSAYIQQINGIDTIPDFPSWKGIRTQALISGQVTVEGSNIKVEFRLWDILSGKQTLAKSFKATSQGWRRVAHLISDEIYEYLTGEQGYFDTRIVYIAESGNWKRKVKRLAIMEQTICSLPREEAWCLPPVSIQTCKG